MQEIRGRSSRDDKLRAAAHLGMGGGGWTGSKKLIWTSLFSRRHGTNSRTGWFLTDEYPEFCHTSRVRPFLVEWPQLKPDVIVLREPLGLEAELSAAYKILMMPLHSWPEQKLLPWAAGQALACEGGDVLAVSSC
jgi:hypothetical protein